MTATSVLERTDESESNTATISLVIFSCGHASVTMEALDRALTVVGKHRCSDITVLAPLASGAARAVRSSADRSVRLMEVPAGMDATQCWTEGLSHAAGDWVLLLSDDVHLRDFEEPPPLAAPSGPANVLAPSLWADGVEVDNHSLHSTRRVCLLISREGLLTDSLTAPRVSEQWNADTAPTAPDDPVVQATPPDRASPAPGGGAPEGPAVYIGNFHFWGSTVGEQARRLHLGSGPYRIPGWTNIDGDAACHPDEVLDLCERLPYGDGSVDLIYSEHLFEHLPLQDGVRLMQEAHRVLAPGGVMRVAMPDLRTLIELYQGNWRQQSWLAHYPFIDSAAHMLNYAVRQWGHVYMYDHAELELRLRQVGFAAVARHANGQSSREALQGLEQRPESVLVVEATKA